MRLHCLRTCAASIVRAQVTPLAKDAQNDACRGFIDVVEKYKSAARKFELAGPTSFKPIIDKAIEIVERQRGYHILWILCDGQVTHERETISTCCARQSQLRFQFSSFLFKPASIHAFIFIGVRFSRILSGFPFSSSPEAIVEASKYPMSIICIGIGDGPWEAMQDFDDKLPAREFDNVRHAFVVFASGSALLSAESPVLFFALLHIAVQLFLVLQNSCGTREFLEGSAHCTIRTSGAFGNSACVELLYFL